MNFTGQIEQINYNPITEYNNFLKGQLPQTSRKIDDFTKMLDEEIAKQDVPMDENGALLKKLGDAVKNGLNSVNEDKIAAERLQLDFAMGKNVSVHDMMIAAEKANLSMQMALQIRNRLQSAYREITNMAL